MTMRVRIGAKGSDRGIFVSRPGDDVINNKKSLLLDSRFDNLRIYQKGRVRMDKVRYDNSESPVVFWKSISFASLGYEPLVWGAFIYQHSNSSGYPVNSAFYPAAMPPLADSNFKYAGFWLASNSELRAKAVIKGTSSADFDFSYIIFENPVD